MTILAVAREVAPFIGTAQPLALVSSTTRADIELLAVANEAAQVIAEAFDWQVLRRQATLTGDGAREDFDLPTDYARMPNGARVWSSRYRNEMSHVVEPDEWLAMQVMGLVALPYGMWSIFGGQMHMRPKMAAGETARFFYQRSDVITGGGTRFTADSDVFRVDERLLKLAMIYLWKQEKGQDFTAELSDYEIALAKAIDRDGGSKPVISGRIVGRRHGRPGNVWPGTVRG